MSKQRAVIIAISGCSSSGKTTLARILRDLFPNTFILHEDDFYLPEERLPLRHGFTDWDCPEAISIADMEKTLSHIRATGNFPPDLDSKEDKNSVGVSPVSGEKISEMKAKVEKWLQPGQPGHRVSRQANLKVCLLDGFLLYCEPMAAVMAQMDLKLFVLVSRAKAMQRREARDGYVTLEGFWKDPPGYVDKIVWPNYANAHGWLFEDGDVEGKLDIGVLERNGIYAQTDEGLDVDFGTTLEWAVETIMRYLEAWSV